MSDGTLNFPVRATAPSSPTVNRSKIWVSGVDGKPKITDENGVTTGFESVFGMSYQFAQDQFEDTNTTQTFKTYTGFVYPAGLNILNSFYEIHFTATTRYSVAGRNHVSRVALDGVTVGEEIQVEHKDVGADIRVPIAYTHVIQGSQLQAGGGFIEFDFKAQQNGDTARIYSATITFKRVL